MQVRSQSNHIYAPDTGLLRELPRALARTALPEPRVTQAPSPTPAQTYLSDTEATELLGPLEAKLPGDIVTRLEVPRVDPKWYLREPSGSIVTLPGSSPLRTGRSPWFLRSPAKLPASVPESGACENVPTDQPWRFGYYPVIADDGVRSMGAFIAQLPPDFDPKHPASSVKRIVMVIGSGDNRARSILGDFGGFSAPGTLFVAFDMPLMSVGMKTPGGPGPAALTQGLGHMRKTLGLADGIPEYVTGFSAGGAGALVQAFQDFPEIKAAAALSPVIQEWNVHTELAKVPATIPPTHHDQFAKTSARGTPFELTLTYAAQVARSYFTPEQFAQLSPQHRLAQGDLPRVPLLVVGGTADEIAEPVVRSTVELASFTTGLTLPVVFGPQDDQEGRSINIEGFADALAKRPGLAAVTVQGLTHRTNADLQRPDGKAWHVDSRALAMRFFLELERAGAAQAADRR